MSSSNSLQTDVKTRTNLSNKNNLSLEPFTEKRTYIDFPALCLECLTTFMSYYWWTKFDSSWYRKMYEYSTWIDLCFDRFAFEDKSMDFNQLKPTKQQLLPGKKKRPTPTSIADGNPKRQAQVLSEGRWELAHVVLRCFEDLPLRPPSFSRWRWVVVT